MELIFIRHFDSMGNQNPYHYFDPGDRHLSLSDKGRMQAPESAQALDTLLAQYDIQNSDEILVLRSPYQRTKETFEEIQKHSTNPLIKSYGNPQQEEWLSELHMGEAWDLNEDEKKAIYPKNSHEIRRRATEDPANFKFLYGETPEKMLKTVQQANLPAQLAAWQQAGKKLVICVSHQLGINTVRAALLEEKASEILAGNRLSNGALLDISVYEDGSFSAPECKYGTYAPHDLSNPSIQAMSPNPTGVCPVKKILHTVKAASRPEGLLVPEEEGPDELETYETPNLVSSFIERSLRERTRPDKTPLR